MPLRKIINYCSRLGNTKTDRINEIVSLIKEGKEKEAIEGIQNCSADELSTVLTDENLYHYTPLSVALANKSTNIVHSILNIITIDDIIFIEKKNDWSLLERLWQNEIDNEVIQLSRKLVEKGAPLSKNGYYFVDNIISSKLSSSNIWNQLKQFIGDELIPQLLKRPVNLFKKWKYLKYKTSIKKDLAAYLSSSAVKNKEGLESLILNLRTNPEIIRDPELDDILLESEKIYEKQFAKVLFKSASFDNFFTKLIS